MANEVDQVLPNTFEALGSVCKAEKIRKLPAADEKDASVLPVAMRAGRCYFETQQSDEGDMDFNWAAVGVTTEDDEDFPSEKMFFNIEENKVSSSDGKVDVSKPQPEWTDTVGCLVNFDTGTLSFYVNGSLHAGPVSLPGDMVGAPLYPTVWSDCPGARINVEGDMWKPLPFKQALVLDMPKEHFANVVVDVPEVAKVPVVGEI